LKEPKELSCWAYPFLHPVAFFRRTCAFTCGGSHSPFGDLCSRHPRRIGKAHSGARTVRTATARRPGGPAASGQNLSYGRPVSGDRS
jgi:hypothetical protein